MSSAEEYGGAFAAAWMRRFGESVLATENELTQLDQQAGDGDFGSNLSSGLRLVLDRLAGLPDVPATPGEPLTAAAEVFLDQVGGTSGPLFGLLLEELADAAAQAPRLDASTVRRGAEAGLAAIQRVGEAEPGDKTMVDALTPAVVALEQVPDGTPLGQAFTAASEAAWDGVRNTTRLSARRGRASYLGERASGVPDPGAVGVGLLFSAATEKVTRLPALH